jgi:hypothetical protein
MKRSVALVMAVLMACEVSLFAGLGSNKTMYVGGTIGSIKQGTVGKSSAADEKVFVFTYKGGDLKIPYNEVTALSYGQHAGRRVGATVALGVTTLGIGALPVLFSKKRRHYLTLEYKDDKGTGQAAVFEIGKDAIRTTLSSLEVRTGKKVQYEDAEARKAGNK